MVASSTALGLLVVSCVSAGRLDPRLTQTLRQRSTANIIVQMKDGVDASVKAIASQSFSSRKAKIETLVKQLKSKAQLYQSDVLQVLQQEGNAFEYSKVNSYWINNAVGIKGANRQLIDQLKQLPNVEHVREERIFPLPKIMTSNTTEESLKSTWGVAQVGARALWKAGNKGAGIIVGSIDTGARATHQSIKDNWVGLKKHGWFDPFEFKKVPLDAHGHGTHTIGTMVGQNGLGVAPEAKWLACRGCLLEGCHETTLMYCGQYMMCPTDTNGENPDCSLAPHIVSNSWGGGQGFEYYEQVTKAWRAVGIIPVFSAGNNGPTCGTIGSPSDADHVISVGASTVNFTLASFSSVGPSAYKTIKPDLVAPGQEIISAWPTADDGFAVLSGTSMACPHVSGLIALMLSQKPTLKYDDIYEALTGSAIQKGLKAFGKNCGGIRENVFPNNAFGHGVVNVEAAMMYLNGARKKKATPCRYDLSVMNCVPSSCTWSWKAFKCMST